jgi:hypothetical protein
MTVHKIMIQKVKAFILKYIILENKFKKRTISFQYIKLQIEGFKIEWQCLTKKYNKKIK